MTMRSIMFPPARFEGDTRAAAGRPGPLQRAHNGPPSPRLPATPGSPDNLPTMNRLESKGKFVNTYI